MSDIRANNTPIPDPAPTPEPVEVCEHDPACPPDAPMEELKEAYPADNEPLFTEVVEMIHDSKTNNDEWFDQSALAREKLRLMNAAVGRTDAAISQYASIRHQLFDMFHSIQANNPAFFNTDDIDKGHSRHDHAYLCYGHRRSTYVEMLNDISRSFGVMCTTRKDERLMSLEIARRAAFKESMRAVKASVCATLVFDVNTKEWMTWKCRLLGGIKEYVTKFINESLSGDKSKLRIGNFDYDSGRDAAVIDAIIPGAGLFFRYEFPRDKDHVEVKDVEEFVFAGEEAIDIKYLTYKLPEEVQAKYDAFAKKFKDAEDALNKEQAAIPPPCPLPDKPEDGPSWIPTKGETWRARRVSLDEDSTKSNRGRIITIIFKVAPEIFSNDAVVDYEDGEVIAKSWVESYKAFLDNLAEQYKLNPSGNEIVVTRFSMPLVIATLESEKLNRLLSYHTYEKLTGALVQFFIDTNTRVCALNNFSDTEFSTEKFVTTSND